MSRLMSLDKQLENISSKWYIQEYYGREIARLENYNYSSEKEKNVVKREFISKIKQNLNKEDVVKTYLEKHPNVKRQYKLKKQKINKLKKMAGLGLLTVAIGTGATVYTTSNHAPKQQNVEIQQEINEYKPITLEAQEYTKFFNEIKNIQNTEERDGTIVNFTKEKIAEAYNEQNQDAQITTDRLQYLHLNEHVIVNKDAMGNDVSYERVNQTDNVKTNENQELKKLDGGIYEFKIDGQTVAVYNANGQEVQDKEIENKDEFFKNTLGFVKQAEKLQDVYKYMSNENDIKNAENKYKSMAEDLNAEKQAETIEQDKEI